jgi:hypothetical protein
MLALITGATKGIGRAIVEALSDEGHDIIAISSSADNLTLLKNEIESKYGNNCHTLACDLTNYESRKNLIINLSPFHDNIDILVNNFGRYAVGSIEEETSASIQSLFNINFFSAFEISQPLMKAFKIKKSGFIFNILSVLAKDVRPAAASYSISKHALKALNDLMKEELRPFGVKVCGIYPGSVNTPSWDGIPIDRSKMIQPEDIASFIQNSIKVSPNAFMEEVTFRPIDPEV